MRRGAGVWMLALLAPGVARGQSYDILWYDHGEEADGAGLVAHLEAAGHTITYVADGGADVDLSDAAYADIDVVVAEDTAGAGTLLHVDAWLSSGRGYVGLVGPGMWSDAGDDWVRTSFNVDANGEPTGDAAIPGTMDWEPMFLDWLDPLAPQARWPNDASTFSLDGIDANNPRTHLVVARCGTLLVAADAFAACAGEGVVMGAGRVVLLGTYFTGEERENPNTRALVENLVVWAAGPWCGDGLLHDSEACDDGNHVDGDGCSMGCEVEHGFACTLDEPSVCGSACGDGLLASDEGCDDANGVEQDGCDGGCEVEDGWACDGEPSACAPICGDGVVAGDEGCDDGDTAAGDGCDARCRIEPGWVCGAEAPSVCTPLDDGEDEEVAVDEKGCGCRTSGAGGRGPGAPLLATLLLSLFWRRRLRP